MKNKKIKFLIVLLVFLFTCIINVNALTCKYSDGKLTAEFKVNEKKNKAEKAKIKGTIVSKDRKKINEKKQSVENWTKKFKPAKPDINAIGADYFKNYQDCPPYSIFVDRKGQFDFAVFTESHKSEFEKYGKSKQGYAIMKLTSSSKEPEKDGTDIDYKGGSCLEYTTEHACETNEYFACIWNETEFGNYCNTDNLMYVQCGDAFDIPYQTPRLISFAVNLLKIATPIILVIVSIISLIKALTNSNEDEIKKAQKSLIRKIIAAVMVFFVISIVQFIIMKVADSSEKDDISSCLTCFLNNDCDNSIYSKTNVGGKYICKYLDGSKKTFNCKGNK